MRRYLHLTSALGVTALGVVAMVLALQALALGSALAAPATTDIEAGVLGSSVPITAPLLVEGFEGSWPPDGWLLQQLAPSGLWSPTPDAAMVHSGSIAAIHPWGYGEADSWLVTSLVTPTPSSQLEFWQCERYSDPARHSVYISTGRQDPKYGDFILLGEVSPPPEDKSWEAIPPLSLAAYAGKPVFLAFRYEGTKGDDWAIDDVTVTTGLSAVASTPVLVNATTTFTATIAADRDAAFTWNLGDGTTKAGVVVTHTYTAPGAYTAIVTATNASSQVVADTRVVAWAQVFLPLAVRQ